MGRYSNNEPVGHTCPLIDSVIDFIENNTDEVSELEVKEVVSILEKIRSANDALRTWGNELCKEKDDMESDYEDEIKYLKRKIDNLEHDLNQKNEEISTLEQSLSYA